LATTIRCLLLVLASIAGIAPGRAIATAQEPDRLLLDGKQESLHTNPLSAWLEQHPQALAGVTSRSSANWRGYVATWEVLGDELLLRRVDVASDLGPDDDEERVEDIAPKLFPGTDPIVATWYSGALVVPRGELVNYVHMGYGSDYERYVVLVVREGKVTARRDLDQKQFRDFRKARFAAWKKTPQYAAAAADLRDSEHGEEWEEADIDDFFAGFYAEQYLSMEPAPKPVARRKAEPKPKPKPEPEPEVEVE
jgi:hypothetical protein